MSQYHQLLNKDFVRSPIHLAKRLHALTVKNGYQIIQTNGQRVYAPSNINNLPIPPRGCELFIGKIHKDVYEDELIPLFENYGTLYKFRLMLDFVEKNRGYAFATYFNSQDAKKALDELNRFEIRPGSFLVVSKSLDNTRLFVGNIPPDIIKHQVFDLVRQYSQGVIDVIMYNQPGSPSKNRGFAFVEYDTHRAAALARRQFTPDNLKAWGVSLYVDWSSPEPEVDTAIMEKVANLYLRNLPLYMNNEDIKNFIYRYVDATTIKKFHKIDNYGFLHFNDRSSAEIGYQSLKNIVIDGYHVSVEWARPRDFSKKYRQNIPDHFCTSVPPRVRKMIYELKGKTTPPRGSRLKDDYISPYYENNSLINENNSCASSTPIPAINLTSLTLNDSFLTDFAEQSFIGSCSDFDFDTFSVLFSSNESSN